ncbi:hypothetical protein WEI85_00035 [Actinomycetes bacterium KLBMP 9797]
MTDRRARTVWARQRTEALLAAGLLGFAWLGVALQRGPVNLGAAALVVLIVAPLRSSAAKPRSCWTPNAPRIATTG